ncbi:hypothetical protein HELRODRAFT_182719 [Helobdella robusta]|uniref:Uncharacterized protein n=1 Tax=Helobdella robusta TaxID=6412 RepID=T1FIN0_HELRO|nr:hypothetical protein HELRODRAFT_182719 [Helobdella robusta]ESN90222.1 hypothetical protein HELRODRAFT_182719 [Helobdella robusta]
MVTMCELKRLIDSTIKETLVIKILSNFKTSLTKLTSFIESTRQCAIPSLNIDMLSSPLLSSPSSLPTPSSSKSASSFQGKMRLPSKSSQTSLSILEKENYSSSSSSLPSSSTTPSSSSTSLLSSLANLTSPETSNNNQRLSFVAALSSHNNIKNSTTAAEKKDDNDVRALFPDDDDDDDWEGLDGEKDESLNAAGMQLKKLLKKNNVEGEKISWIKNNNTSGNDVEKVDFTKKQRIAHKPSTTSTISSTISSSSLQPKLSAAKASSATVSKDSSMCITSLMGIRSNPEITSSYTADHCSNNPLVPADQMRLLMNSRSMIRMSTLRSKVGSDQMKMDWVTIGVLISKSDPKISAKGQKFSIWKLSDLADCDQAPICMFLFRDVNDDLSKIMVGTVLGFLNPSIMKNNDKSKNFNDISLTVDNAKKILPLGQSKDFGICKGLTKAGNTCTNFINKNQGDYCSFHVQKAYKAHSAKRSELQNGPLSRNTSNISLKSLLDHAAQQNSFLARQAGVSGTKVKNQVSTLMLHDLVPNVSEQKKSDLNVVAEENLKKKKEDAVFHDLLIVPTVGAMNFVQHLKNNDPSNQAASSPSTSKSTKDGVADKTVLSAKQALLKLKNLKTSNNYSDEMNNSLSTVPKLGRNLGSNMLLNLEAGLEKNGDDVSSKTKSSEEKAKVFIHLKYFAFSKSR